MIAMTWQQARLVARNGLHVRRESWTANEWLIYQRGVAWFFNGTVWRVVTAEDFESAEFQGSDWTTIPADLAACPLNPDGTSGSAIDPGDTEGSGSGSGGDYASSPGSIPGGVTLPTPGSAVIIQLPGGRSTTVGHGEASLCIPPTFHFQFTANYSFVPGVGGGYAPGWTVRTDAPVDQTWSISVMAGPSSVPFGEALMLKGETSASNYWDWPTPFDHAWCPIYSAPPYETFTAVAQITGFDGPCAGYTRRLTDEYSDA